VSVALFTDGVDGIERRFVLNSVGENCERFHSVGACDIKKQKSKKATSRKRALAILLTC
jgi:hypothetical protein